MRALLPLLLLTAIAPAARADLANQMNVNLGVDMPNESAEHASNSMLLRFQLQTPPKIFRFQTAFTAAMGSGLKMGEFSVGGSAYFLGKLLENSRIQPFVGADGIGAFGEKDGKATLTGGYSLFAGTDLKIFGKLSGMSFSIAYTSIGQQSLRFWLGVFFIKL